MVRIAKMRREISKQDMITEVVQQLGTLFQPSPDVIRLQARILVEKGYLEAKETTYVYKP